MEPMILPKQERFIINGLANERCEEMTIKKAFTIAGSDSGGGAGIQADLKTFQELGVFGMSAITAITAQNTLGVHGIYPLSIEVLERQIDAVAEDLPPDAVKTGMLWSADMIKIVAEKTVQYDMKLIVDPVMIAKGGASLLNEDAVSAMKTNLLPVSYAVTPNLPEAEVLTGIQIQTKKDRYVAAEHLYELGTKHVVIKGGHGPSDGMITDLLYDGKGFIEITNEHIAEDEERTKRLKSNILNALMKKKYKELREMTLEMHPADLASVLEDLDENNRLVVFRLLRKDVATEAFTFMSDDVRAELVEGFSDAEIVNTIEE
ncbi:MAG: bifunctional hydroxymethylpyrimidine kinase/phosphomethylpyrimidine kinase, partial [Bacillus sp. (in: Bacteria)]|nr:bifunctional hydroxymethylpyrimidine kinase/phosphomethylpyrimidine kinase [Bacillus sp. (in: firmicutes)]